jgi:acyl-CoA reductase-like NAD-dependent aldehyde dehydrogenase
VSVLASALPGDDLYARNLIGGRWVFPAAPYEFEIRSPYDSSVTAVVPLSSRFDVARAVAAAAEVAPSWTAEAGARVRLVTLLVGEIEALAGPLAELQAVETGLTAADSHSAVRALIAWCQRLLAAPPMPPMPSGSSGSSLAGVSAHVLSWGLPLAEIACAVLPHLLAGRTAVVKPSLRAPLSAVAFVHLATRLGFPPGVVNLVHGTGLDVGAALLATPGLAALHVRGGHRTLQAAQRAVASTGVSLSLLRAGGNVAVAGADADPQRTAASIVDALQLHSMGGPLGLPLLLVHASRAAAVTEAVLARLPHCRPAPLPSEPLRCRALERVVALRDGGAEVLSGGAVPDDAAHRMAWRMPAVVVAGHLPPDLAGEPIGPVLVIRPWHRADELAAVLDHPRYADGIACLWGLERADPVAGRLPQTVTVEESGPAAALTGAAGLPAPWTGGLRR